MSPKSREIMTANKGNGIMFMSMRVNVKLPKIQRNVDNEMAGFRNLAIDFNAVMIIKRFSIMHFTVTSELF